MNVHSVSLFRHDASGYESPRAGTSQGIFFSNFLPTLVRAHFAAFKGWELRIHHDDRVREFPYFKVLHRLHEAGMIRMVAMGEAPTLCGAMLWRLSPVMDPDVGYFICRDVDSLPMHRDRKMVDEFIASGAYAHAILDSESHCGPMMGGMVGFKAQELHKILHFPLPFDAQSLSVHGSDQKWLNTFVWPKLASKTLIHQRRDDIIYPNALRTLKAPPQETELDKVVRHVGAAYPREKAMEVLQEHHRYQDVSGVYRIECLETMQLPERGGTHTTNKTGRPDEPWYVRDAITFLEGVIKPEWSVFEAGGGGSTVWYSNRCYVEYMENDPFWKILIRHHANGKRVREVSAPFGNDLYDLCAVDGPDRMHWLVTLRSNVKPGGYLLLDNSDEPAMKEAGEILLGWERKDFTNGIWQTTIWRRPL